MRVTSKGQVTIPLDIRRRMGIGAHAEVEFVIEDDAVILRPLNGTSTKGKRVVESLRGRASVKMTTDEIMALTRGGE
ncbi:AbrB/MazE/SpoVT family DNA-binding domain-containing protein [Geomonas propionica]|uniref:AbrB/MazE/SpoVT family DNA-binding domain-containing protein n=1 Tax=Geomonas propionica TaxID=2798582 RepID=A0ABS0YKR6_9BACT|nr:AbrB/MazE/SpoVT family DNA-binding domain-containing protein [Geomonas propionica]MBJ6798538.1 AbrB/MazE/SpoVT family DNA-binding domain-containing protein [Geomonas propionica]